MGIIGRLKFKEMVNVAVVAGALNFDDWKTQLFPDLGQKIVMWECETRFNKVVLAHGT